ncbi:MAG: sodium-dependent transporter [Thermoguttaceae bacterium]|nr:sodium-dependent transporter [Thermoguttaceae bacterium]
MKEKNQVREHWGGSLGFVLAAAGSAIGLGNLWKFPYVTGQNGGGAFILVYLLAVLVIGFPVMVCEIAIGRHAQVDPISAFQKICPKGTGATKMLGVLILLAGGGLLCFGKFGLAGLFFLSALVIFWYGWAAIGLLSVITPFFILSFYVAVGGWTIAYFFKGIFQQLNFADAESARQVFVNFTNNPLQGIIFQLLFTVITGSVIWFGIKNGIELASKFLMPVLLVFILVLIMRSVTLQGASAGISYLLTPDFSKITPHTFLAALGQAFFSLSLGMGAIMTYGSYLDSEKNILSSTLFIIVADTFFALLAGLAIFPAVMAMGMEPSEGAGLAFQVMPLTFNSIGDHLGWLWSSIFFFLIFIAALTSAISIAEGCVTCLIDHFKFHRKPAVFLTIFFVSIAGVFCTLSVSDWSRLPLIQKGLIWAFGSADSSLFDLMDHFSSNYMLPLGGLGTSLFVGWQWGMRYALAELRKGGSDVTDINFFALVAGLKDDPMSKGNHSMTLALILGFLIRFIAPVSVILVFLSNIGWLSLN